MESTLATLMAIERTKNKIRKTIIRFWVQAVFVGVVIKALSSMIVIAISNMGLTIKIVLEVIIVVIAILILIALAFKVNLKDL